MLHNFIILNVIEGSKLKIQQLEYKLKIPGCTYLHFLVLL